MLDLQPIKARLSAATAGPWESAEIREQSRRNSFFSVAVVGGWEVRASIPLQARPDERDADLIANAPTDLAALVAEVERLREAISSHRHVYVAERTKEWETESWAALDEADRKLWSAIDA